VAIDIFTPKYLNAMKEESQIAIYQTDDERINIEVQIGQDSVWLTQAQMALLFEQTKQNISLHINNIFKEEELERESVVKYSLTTASDGKTYRVTHYNLDVIIPCWRKIPSCAAIRRVLPARSVKIEHFSSGWNPRNSSRHAVRGKHEDGISVRARQTTKSKDLEGRADVLWQKGK